MNLIFQRGIDLTALTHEQLKEFVITLLHASKSSLENPSYSHRSRCSRSLLALSHGQLDEYEGQWVLDEDTGEKGFLDLCKDVFWQYDEGKL